MWLAVKTLFLLRIKVGRTDRLASPFPRVLLFLGKVDKVDSKSNYTETQTHRRTLREKQMKVKRNEKEKKKKKKRDASKMVSAFTRRLNVLNGQLVCSVI